MTNNWQVEKYSAANVPQIPGGVTDRHWSMIENLRQTCCRFLVVWLTNIDLWSKICGIRAADSWWCDWQALIYDRKSAAFVPQIPGGVTDRCRTTDRRCNPALLHPQIGYILMLCTKMLEQVALLLRSTNAPLWWHLFLFPCSALH
jgi:hypothetical protein